ncbi:MAG TPA: type 4a pilus biogenesis protein PilO [Gemmatimonadales bacterium]|nr:type 4a pilus biogenesis protein PilO [Gemmatimonadales bacterium]
MALLPTDQRSQVMALLILVGVAGGYFFWTKVQSPRNARLATTRVAADSLERIVAAAKRDLAGGSIEDLLNAVERDRGALAVMRRLVPERNELFTLIDNISSSAKRRGVIVGKIQPQGQERGTPFDTDRTRLEVFGHYDQIGEYISDIASLSRIVVPQELVLAPATPAAQRLLGDTLGGLLLAQFTIRTYVKSARPAPPPGGTGVRR